MVRLSLFKRYQGSESEDNILRNTWSSLETPENCSIRWLRSTDFSNGYRNLKSTESYLNETVIPENFKFNADNDLDFKRQFKGTFPDHSSELKAVVVANQGKVIASGLLYFKKVNESSMSKAGLISDIRLDSTMIESGSSEGSTIVSCLIQCLEALSKDTI